MPRLSPACEGESGRKSVSETTNPDASLAPCCHEAAVRCPAERVANACAPLRSAHALTTPACEGTAIKLSPTTVSYLQVAPLLLVLIV
ncbi:MAG TPA: hypothetical protein VMJ64_00020, partial [Anaerolineales bacterium]|nr:hypothetical protein [Anaerolineales bacterium]